jgi:hypothetical protein
VLLPLRTTPSVAEQEGQLIETEATGAPQKHHHTLNQLAASPAIVTRFGQVSLKENQRRTGTDYLHPERLSYL